MARASDAPDDKRFLLRLGLAVRNDGYPSTLGWAGVGVGIIILVLGTIQHLRPNVAFPGVVLYGGGTIVSQVWTLILAVEMWRRARRLRSHNQVGVRATNEEE